MNLRSTPPRNRLLNMRLLTHSIEITKIPLDEQNRMLRAGFGKHCGKWFIRIDLWFVGFRLAR
jgi:hypothetical protein